MSSSSGIMYAGEQGSVDYAENRSGTARRSTKAKPAYSDANLSAYNTSVYRSNSPDELNSVPLRNTKSRSLKTQHRPTSAPIDPVADPRMAFRSTSMYTGLGLQSDESATTSEFYGTTTTGVCIDEKVLKQISQNQAKFMQDRITVVQKHFGNLCDSFGGYARALCKVRDSGDSLATAMLSLAMDDTLNPTAKASLIDFASHFAAVQDYEESEVRRIEEKVVKPLMNYGTSCKQAKERLKKACMTRKKELEQKKALEKTKEQKPFDAQHVSQAQTSLQKANVNALRAENEVEQEIEAFEKRKLEDLKEIMTDFVGIKVFYHIRALEQLSSCSRAIANMDINTDLEQFSSSLRPLSTQPRINAQRSLGGPGSNGFWSTDLTAKSQHPSLQRKPYPQQQTFHRHEEDDNDEEDEEEYEAETGDEDDESEEESVEAVPVKASRPVISA